MPSSTATDRGSSSPSRWRRASSTTSAPCRSRAARGREGGLLRRAAHGGGRHLQRLADRQDGREADARHRRAGLRVRARAPARGGRSRHAHDRAGLRRRGRAAHLHRAHQHRRQRAHEGPRHPPRVPACRGRRLQPLLVDRAKKRLQALGLFKNVEIKRRPGSAQDRVVLDVELAEQSTGELSFGAGYSTSEGVIGDVSITERNLLGNGQFLRLKVAGSFERFQIDLSFTEPRFLDMNLAAGFDLFHKEVNQQDTSGFSSRKTGGSPGSASRCRKACGQTQLHDRARRDLRRRRPGVGHHQGRVRRDELHPGMDPNCQDSSYWTSSLGNSLTYDQRNHPKNPTRGYYLQLARISPGLGGDVQYVRVIGEPRVLPDHREDHVRGPRRRWPHRGLGRRGRAAARPLLQGRRDGARLRALGLWAARSQQQRRPRRPDVLGGDRRGPLPAAVHSGRPRHQWCGLRRRWLAVQRVGSSGSAQREHRLHPGDKSTVCLADDSSIRSSVGGSILWASPVGPLRLDFAKAITKQNYDELEFIRFGASTKF